VRREAFELGIEPERVSVTLTAEQAAAVERGDGRTRCS